MITKFKIYEKKSSEPELGDWVIVNSFWAAPYLKNWVISHPAQIVFKETDSVNKDVDTYKIEFDPMGDEIPPHIAYIEPLSDKYPDGKSACRIFHIRKSLNKISDHFVYWSKDKDEVLSKIQAEKFNL